MMLRVLLASLLSVAFLFSVFNPLSALAEGYQSRLSQLIRQKPDMYLPTRLILGEENRFVFRAKPGSNITLYLSPKGEGFVLPNGLPLFIGEEHESVSGQIPSSGVLELSLPLPDEEDWNGYVLYVDAITWQTPDGSDAERFEWIAHTGSRAESNALVMSKRTRDGGFPIMPAIPGIPTHVFQQLTTMSEAYNGDERKKELLDTGEINRDTLLDQNSFINRPGGIQPVK